MPEVDEAAQAVEAAATGRPMGWLARTGLAGGKQHIDQRGAVTEVIGAPFGTGLVLLLAVGFAAYAVWRFSEAALGVPGEGDGAGPRLTALARAIAYSVLTVTALSVLGGARGTQAGQQGSLAGEVMSHTGGRWVVGLVGLAIVVVGLVMVREGWSKKFVRYFGSLPSTVRRWVIPLGRIGTASRGVVLVIAGALVMVAAWTAEASKAGGIDAVFRTLLQQPVGAALVLALGAGLAIFGVYGLSEAIYRRVPGDG